MVLTSLAHLAGLLAFLLAVPLFAAPGPKDDAFWYGTAADGTPTVRLYFC